MYGRGAKGRLLNRRRNGRNQRIDAREQQLSSVNRFENSCNSLLLRGLSRFVRRPPCGPPKLAVSIPAISLPVRGAEAVHDSQPRWPVHTHFATVSTALSGSVDKYSAGSWLPAGAPFGAVRVRRSVRSRRNRCVLPESAASCAQPMRPARIRFASPDPRRKPLRRSGPSVRSRSTSVGLDGPWRFAQVVARLPICTCPLGPQYGIAARFSTRIGCHLQGVFLAGSQTSLSACLFS